MKFSLFALCLSVHAVLHGQQMVQQYPKLSIKSQSEKEHIAECAKDAQRSLLFKAYLQTFGPQVLQDSYALGACVSHDCVENFIILRDSGYTFDRNEAMNKAIRSGSFKIIACLLQDGIDLQKQADLLHLLVTKYFRRPQLLSVIAPLVQAGIDIDYKQQSRIFVSDSHEGLDGSWKYETETFKGTVTALYYLVYHLQSRAWENSHESNSEMYWPEGKYQKEYDYAIALWDALVANGASIRSTDDKNITIFSQMLRYMIDTGSSNIWAKRLLDAGATLEELQEEKEKNILLDQAIEAYRAQRRQIIQTSISDHVKDQGSYDSSADIIENVLIGYLN